MPSKFIFCTCIFILKITSVSAQNINADTLHSMVSAGTLVRLHDFPSAYVESRNIDLWFPRDFTPNKPYVILYMHDGQMLFDSTSTWNQQSWDVETTIQRLIDQGSIVPTVVVGIWNSAKRRHEEFFPEGAWYRIEQAKRDSLINKMEGILPDFRRFSPLSEQYLKFLIQEVKPFLEKSFGLTSGKRNTYMAGSSMGGLISWYALCQYPEIFSGAACISTHWPGIHPALLFDSTGKILPEQNAWNPVPPALISWMTDHLPTSGNHKLYFDCGDQTLDALYPEWQVQVDDILRKRNISAINWKTAYYPGTDHSEKAWKARFDQILLFLCRVY